MEKVINICGRDVGFRVNARTPRMYRHMTGRDLLHDLNELKRAYKKGMAAVKLKKPAEDASEAVKKKYNEAVQDAQLSQANLETYEDMAYVMARQYAVNAGQPIAATPDDWLEEFSFMKFYEVLPVILELWAANEETTSTLKNG